MIALIAHLHTKKVESPFMIVAPRAKLQDWSNEFRKWMAGYCPMLYEGSMHQKQSLLEHENFQKSQYNF